MPDSDIDEFIGSLRYERSMAENTCAAYARDLRFFSQYLKKRGISAAGDVKREDIAGFLGEQRSEGRKSTTRARRATAIKVFFKFLRERRFVAKNPAELLHAGANRLGLRVMDGTYAYNVGPAYETPAEIRAYKAQGADVVGMSTVPEAVFAKACGMRVAGLSLVSNLAAGIALRPLGHEEVIAAGEAAKPAMRALVEDFIARL